MERVTRSTAAALRNSYQVATQLDARTSPLPLPAVSLTADGLAYALKQEVFAGTIVQQVRVLYGDLGLICVLVFSALYSPLGTLIFLG